MWISMDRWMNASISSDSIIKTKCKRELSKLSSKQKIDVGSVRNNSTFGKVPSIWEMQYPVLKSVD
ncbi:hypothetical protein T03_16416, partial [Trichinella britovi]